MWVNQTSLIVQAIGTAAASYLDIGPATLKGRLWAPTAVYTALFAWLFAVSARGGELVLPASADGRFAIVLGLYIVLRVLGPYMRSVVPRLIQPCYEQRHHEELPMLFGVINHASNLAGSGVCAVLIAGGVLRG